MSCPALTPEVQRGLHAMACALTAPQAEHPDIRAACDWLRAVSPEGRTLFDREKAHEIIQEEASHVMLGDPYISDPRVDYAGLATAIAERAVRRMELFVRTLVTASGARQKETCAEHVRDQRSPAWWDEHTVVRLVVTHLNEHGAYVLFTRSGLLTLVANTAKQAERQLAYARERWPEGVYAVHKVRFWRDADGSAGDPVYTLVDDIPASLTRKDNC